MQDFEKLGVFYLGRRLDPSTGQVGQEPLLYDAKDLTTHAVCVGMTGSGKTGLGIALLEEAVIDGIPAIVIDPKGDLGNLALAFPSLAPADFRPWVDEAAAARAGMTADQYAEQTSRQWREGLAQWGQDGDRVARFRAAAEVTIYTPGSRAGLPVTVLRSFAAPPPELVADEAARQERIRSAVSGLLGLLGMDENPIQSREHILLSNILNHAWTNGRSLDLAGLIHEIQTPPFDRVGVFDLDSFLSAADRGKLAMTLNNLLASPGFSVWLSGEPLDIQRLLFTPEGKPKLSILSIAHLADSERMFFVTLLLNELLAWMRTQSGTTSLRALLYMDEIFGYFPPTATPPSKAPMLTLLKQARAYGLGIVLATQNPVDLDYKGLANAGTWLIGRLQTERDKARVIEGLASVSAGTGGLDAREFDGLISRLDKRVFLMRSVHEPAPVLFQARWAMSYLCGPLTLPQIRALMKDRETGAAPRAAAVPPPASAVAPAAVSEAGPEGGARPVRPVDMAEYFIRPKHATIAGPALLYRPGILGVGRLHFVSAGDDIDVWQTVVRLAPVSSDGTQVLWDQAEAHGDIRGERDSDGRPGARYAALPGGALSKGAVSSWSSSLKAFLYQEVTLDLMRCEDLKLTSAPGESEGDFRARLAVALREARDMELARLRKTYDPKLASLEQQLQRAQQRIDREDAQVGERRMQTVISVGATVLGALLGRRAGGVGTIGRASTAMRTAGRVSREKEDVARAQESHETLRRRFEELEQSFAQETDRIKERFEPGQIRLSRVTVRPRKSDIVIENVGLAWTPWAASADGVLEPC